MSKKHKYYDNENCNEIISDMDDLYNKMVAAGVANTLNVGNMKPKSNTSVVSNGNNSQSSKTTEPKVIGNVYDTNKSEGKPNKPVRFNIVKFKIYPAYDRAVMDDGISPIGINCKLIDDDMADDINDISYDDWVKRYRNIFLTFTLSTRYPSALITINDFNDLFTDFKGHYNIMNNSHRRFIPIVVSDDYVGIYIVDMDSVEKFEEFSYQDNGMTSLFTNWIQLINSSCLLQNTFLIKECFDSIYENTKDERNVLINYIKNNFSDNLGRVDYDKIIQNMESEKSISDKLKEAISKISPNYGFDGDDEDDVDTNSILDSSNKKKNKGEIKISDFVFHKEEDLDETMMDDESFGINLNSESYDEDDEDPEVIEASIDSTMKMIKERKEKEHEEAENESGEDTEESVDSESDEEDTDDHTEDMMNAIMGNMLGGEKETEVIKPVDPVEDVVIKPIKK